MTDVVYIAVQQFCDDDQAPLEILRQAGLEVRRNTLGRRLRRDDMPTALREADAVIAGVEPYDAAVLASLPSLRCISRCGTGTDSIDLAAARRQGIAVYRTLEEVVAPVAELTVAMMLALARNVPRHMRDMGSGVWQKRTGVLLSEWTVGLIGFGRIGRAVERLLRAFGPRILIADPAVGPARVPAGVAVHSLDELLAASDLVSLHAERRREDGVLIGADQLARMKPGSYLVNTARGFLVDERALYGALTSGHLAGAALDVFEQEPPTGPLVQLPQVLCTPHVATLTRASRAAMERRCAQNVLDWLAGTQMTAAPVLTPSCGKQRADHSEQQAASSK